MLRQASIIGVVAIGAHFIILLGDIDLSLAANLSLSGVVMASLMVNNELPPLAAGAGRAGARRADRAGQRPGRSPGSKINAIITTLGMMSILEGLAFIMTQGKTIFGDPISTHQVPVERHAARRDPGAGDHPVHLLRGGVRGAAAHDLRRLRLRQRQQRTKRRGSPA